MKTRINPVYLSGFMAGLRVAAFIIRKMSGAGNKSVHAAAIMKRHTDTELMLSKWRMEGII